jgi:hypothetical protein
LELERRAPGMETKSKKFMKKARRFTDRLESGIDSPMIQPEQLVGGE